MINWMSLVFIVALGVVAFSFAHSETSQPSHLLVFSTHPSPNPTASDHPMHGGAPLSSPSANSSGRPESNPSVGPSPVNLPVNKNMLMREFLKAQRTELKALEHQQRFEMKELKIAQEAREKEWNKTESDARHQFFETHPKGPDRRAYVQEFILRRDALRKNFNDERNQKKQEQEAKLKAIQQDQALRLKDFKQALDQGITPSAAFWPRLGR